MRLYSHTKGQGQDLVLIHGWGFHSGIWGDFAQKLAEHYRVTVIDLPGFGQSPNIDKPYTLENIIDVVLELAPSRAIYLGWSLGGLVATQIAIKHSERISALVCLASSPCFIEQADWPGISKAALEQFSEDLSQDYQKTLNRFLSLQAPDLARVDLLALKKIFSVPPAKEAIFGGLKLLENTDLRQDLAKIQCPVLFVLGTLDALVPVKIKDKLQTYTTAKIEVIQQAGHIPFISHQALVLNLLRGWLNG